MIFIFKPLLRNLLVFTLLSSNLYTKVRFNNVRNEFTIIQLNLIKT